ncbi:glycoside hydrolase family 27 protein [Aplosporella prunicola CBS 121167]|uniref:Alpha-galactosidase n=1 Tax=Aplosporella prunicola CBS 121167 TaxID=1176127 RepID=A0A6A6B4K5_9PEZI|nr:glycoside hydrolase family 27 protein [Aplosporella prunicola CBS 121167]KAF2138195.1 glycoside hydrolase family 27 protein [Aplosporella prunicola CBS 121167]
MSERAKQTNPSVAGIMISQTLFLILSFLLACSDITQRAAAATIRTPTPLMGWNSYNHYGCYPNETLIKANAAGLLAHGLADLGYNTVTVDCGWPAKERTPAGRLTWNATLFPSGFPALGDWLHERGLKFGLYSGGGKWECDNVDGEAKLPASLGKEREDARSFADWGGDTLKYDNCWANVSEGISNYHPSERDPSTRFRAMADALNAQNRSIVYQICQWGVGNDLGRWAAQIGDSWRISNDIVNNWQSIWRIANQVVPFWRHTGVGRYADMDMLIVGLKALTPAQERTHFTLWSLAKSPLVLGLPLTSTEPPPASSLAILSNRAVLAINQDALGQQARLARRYDADSPAGGYDVWAGELTEGRTVAAVVNWRNASRDVVLDLSALGLHKADAAYDVWADEEVGPLDARAQFRLDAHDVKLLVLGGLTPAQQNLTQKAYYAATSASLTRGARAVSCAPGACLPAGSKVTDLAPGADVTFENVAGGQQLVLDYVNYDVALESAWTDGTNTRNVTVSVNGGEARRWEVPISGGNWEEAARMRAGTSSLWAWTRGWAPRSR